MPKPVEQVTLRECLSETDISRVTSLFAVKKSLAFVWGPGMKPQAKDAAPLEIIPVSPIEHIFDIKLPKNRWVICWGANWQEAEANFAAWRKLFDDPSEAKFFP